MSSGSGIEDELEFGGQNLDSPTKKEKKKKKYDVFTIIIVLFCVVCGYAIFKDTLWYVFFPKSNNLQKEITQKSKEEPKNIKTQKKIATKTLAKKPEDSNISNTKIASATNYDFLVNGQPLKKEVKKKSIKDSLLPSNPKNQEYKATEEEKKREDEWKRRVGSIVFKEDVNFILNGDFPRVIANNFLQESLNIYQISGVNAVISAIVLEKPKNPDDILDLVLKIDSTKNTASKYTYNITAKYPLAKFANLHFFEDSIVKTEDNQNKIFVKGDNIFPYIKIMDTGIDENGNIFAYLQINQQNFGGKDFIYKYIKKSKNKISKTILKNTDSNSSVSSNNIDKVKIFNIEDELALLQQ